MNDAEIQKNAAVIKTEVAVLAKDVARLDERAIALMRHFQQAGKDIELIQTSSKKITARAGKIAKVEFDAVEAEGPTLKLVGDAE